MPAKMMVTPYPPASTTPASRSTESISGPRRTLSSPAVIAVSRIPASISFCPPPSATGKTLRSLISCRRDSRCASAPSSTVRNRTRLGSVTAGPGTALDGLEDLAGLEAAGADVDAPGRAVDQRPDLLEVGIEAAL